jgi:hypothetical protein
LPCPIRRSNPTAYTFIIFGLYHLRSVGGNHFSSQYAIAYKVIKMPILDSLKKLAVVC